jgi:anti-sigma B factor antagonist
MLIKQKLHGQVDVLSLNGKLVGGEETSEIHAAIKSALGKNITHIVIDLRDVSWMGSVGIGILICCLTTVRSAGGDLKLAGLTDKVMKVLLMTKLDTIFEIYPQIDQAVNSFHIH